MRLLEARGPARLRKEARFALALAAVALLAQATPARAALEDGPGPLPWRVPGRIGFTVDAVASPDSAGQVLDVFVRVPPATLSAMAIDSTRVSRLRVTARLRGGFGGKPREEVREFAISQAGQPIARSWGRYAGRTPDGLHRFETRIELVAPGRATARSEVEILLDDRGALVRGFERSDAAELRFERKNDVLRTTDGTRNDEIAYTPERSDTAFMAHSAILHEEMMFALRDIVDGALGWRLISLSGGVPVEWTGQVLRTTAEGERIEIDTSLGERVLIVDGRISEIWVESTDLRVVASIDPSVARLRYCLGTTPFDAATFIEQEGVQPSAWRTPFALADTQRRWCTPWYRIAEKRFEEP